MILGEILREQKIDRYTRQHGRCYVCDKKILSHEIYSSELAHRIIKSKANIKKYGKEIIHHWLNTPLVCSKKCNSAVIIKSWSNFEDYLITEIAKDLKNKELKNERKTNT